jgi:hypothetical protein
MLASLLLSSSLALLVAAPDAVEAKPVDKQRDSYLKLEAKAKGKLVIVRHDEKGPTNYWVKGEFDPSLTALGAVQLDLGNNKDLIQKVEKLANKTVVVSGPFYIYAPDRPGRRKTIVVSVESICEAGK